MAGFTPVNVAGNYLAGRAAAQDHQYGERRNVLADQRIQQNTQEMQQQQQQFSAEQQKQVATKMMQTAQWALQSSNPKQFVEQNAPELAQAAGPEWATADDNMVRLQLQDLVGKYGPQAGVAPGPRPVKWEERKGPRGSIIQVNPETGEQKQVIGPDNTQPSVGSQAPSGYRFNPDGTLSPIKGGPADPNTPNTKDDTRIFAKADKLRDEFNTQSKDFIAVGDSYSTVQAAANDPSAAGDLSMIFAYMKMLDPNSVVREQEFANAQNAAGVPDRIRNQWNKVLEGERLNPAQRKDFIAQAKKVYEVRKTRHKSIVNRYTEIAKRNKVNPDDVVGDMGVVDQQQTGPVQVKSAAEAMALPPGTVFITPDGRQKVRP
jgi:hypothetical protein